MNIKYKLKKLYPGIYHVLIKDEYDLAMTFCRAQEFYESPYKEIRNKRFNLLEFMTLYTKRRGEKTFTYPVDWCGFNIPGKVIEELYCTALEDFNEYDNIITQIHDHIVEKIDSHDYYLIGSAGDRGTVMHELCHGLYALNKEYRDKANEIIIQIPSPIYKEITNYLLGLGYCNRVLLDEVQAYLSTDYASIRASADFTKKDLKLLENLSKEFKLNLKQYTKGLKL